VSRRHLLVVTSSFPASDDDSRNAGVFVVDLARLLVERGWDVTVVSPQRSTVTGPFEVRSFPRLGDEASLTHVDPRSVRGLIQLASVMIGGVVTVPLLARARRSAHVLALWAVPSGALALVARALTRTRYSVWALGSDIWRIRDYPGGRVLLRSVLRRASRIYADGVELASDTAEIAGRPCQFLATSRVLAPGHPGLWNDGASHVVTIARLHEHKGVDVLLDAVASLPAEVRDGLVVHVYGDGPERDALERRAAREDLVHTVRFEGMAGPGLVADALASADLAVVPSRLESIPLVLSDICRAGTPLVVTDAGDMGELVRRFDAGDVVPTGDAAALSASIARALSGTQPPGSAEGRAALAEHLSLEGSVARILADLDRAGA
jgi:glycosyltransferase involved in cell wall biosynthesis